MDSSVRLTEGGSLTLEAGVVLAFREGTGLVAEAGALQARGTQEEPVVFTAKTVSPRPGYWHGLMFTGPDKPLDRKGLPTSLLEHVIIEYGGGERSCDPRCPRGGLVVSEHQLLHAWARGAATSFGSDVTIRHGVLRHNAALGLYADSPSTVAELTKLSFGPNGGVSAYVHPYLVEGLGTLVPEAVVVSGLFERSMTFRKLAVPYVFEHVVAHAAAQPIAVTIEEGTTVAFADQGSLEVHGRLAEAKLVAHHVTFTSASKQPVPGSWFGIGLLGWAAADLEDDVFEYSGLWEPAVPRPGHAAISIARDEERVHIARCTFRRIAGPAIEANSCQRWAGLGNVAQGQALCRKRQPL